MTCSPLTAPGRYNTGSLQKERKAHLPLRRITRGSETPCTHQVNFSILIKSVNSNFLKDWTLVQVQLFFTWVMTISLGGVYTTLSPTKRFILYCTRSLPSPLLAVAEFVPVPILSSWWDSGQTLVPIPLCRCTCSSSCILVVPFQHLSFPFEKLFKLWDNSGGSQHSAVPGLQMLHLLETLGGF